MDKIAHIRKRYYLLGQQAAMIKLSEESNKPKEESRIDPNNLVRQGLEASRKVKIRGQSLPSTAKKIISGLEPVHIASSLTTPEGRKQLRKEYSPLAPEKDSPINIAKDIYTLSTAGPYSPSTYAAGARTIHRSLRGAKKREAQRVDYARKGNTDMVQLMSDQNPKFRGF